MNSKLFLIPLIFLFGCGEQSSQKTETEIIPSCKFVYLDNYYSDYLKTIKTDFHHRDFIFSEKIKGAIIKDHFLKSVYSDLVAESFSYPLADTSGLTNYIGDLEANRTPLETIISTAFAACHSHLKNDSITFYILPSTSDLKEIITRMGGVIGQTAGGKQLLITIDFNQDSWKESLEYTVAHELNHAYWTNSYYKPDYRFTLLRYLVFEGKADAFAQGLYSGVKAPWTTALNDKEKADLWARIKPNLKSEDPILLSEVMFGSKNFPVWGGYTLGNSIVKSAFKNHPELLKTNWTNVEAEKLLEWSDYR